MRIGTAGWTISRETALAFPGEGRHLERYARVLDCAEINSSFHRSHRVEVYERWAAQTPPGFRFSVKLPRSITHEGRLRRAREPLAPVSRRSRRARRPARGAARAAAAVVRVRGAAGAQLLRPARRARSTAPWSASRAMRAGSRRPPTAPSSPRASGASAADPARWPEASRPGGWLGPDGRRPRRRALPPLARRAARVLVALRGGVAAGAGRGAGALAAEARAAGASSTTRPAVRRSPTRWSCAPCSPRRSRGPAEPDGALAAERTRARRGTRRPLQPRVPALTARFAALVHHDRRARGRAHLDAMVDAPEVVDHVPVFRRAARRGLAAATSWPERGSRMRSMFAPRAAPPTAPPMVATVLPLPPPIWWPRMPPRMPPMTPAGRVQLTPLLGTSCRSTQQRCSGVPTTARTERTGAS